MPRRPDHPKTSSQQQARGELLLATVSMIGDQEDLRVWRARRNQWVQETATLLDANSDADEASRFRDLAHVRKPHSSWRVALPEEALCVHRAVSWLGETPVRPTQRALAGSTRVSVMP
ncbi:MAG TPA: hypothetical protein VH025_08445 [Solirubrobacteraceae bacterium]|nr:hypothetical protein [Solirubrobacteraceae bacterium]